MVELTEQQQQALDAEPEPRRVVDPRTNTAYVLVRADAYERVQELLDDEEDRNVQQAFLKASHQAAVAWMKENPY